MPKLITKTAALAALLMAPAMMLVSAGAHAQDYDNGYRDRDTHAWHDRDSPYRYHRYHASAYHRDWIGVGTPGYGIGFYTNRYHHYCSHWDPVYGYCYL